MTRQPDFPIDALFLRRWSARAMAGTPLAPLELMTLLEAARWAPSSGNGQPWRFVYALPGEAFFAGFLDLLVPGNRVWCERAGALLVVLSRTVRGEGKPMRTHSFDAGAAWMSLALQGASLGLVVHAMEGFDYDRAATLVAAPEGHAVEAMVAVGHPGDVGDLPEYLRAREVPSGRERVTTFAYAGRFPAA
jgi:nitroreductase